jgi:hypothetical protein
MTLSRKQLRTIPLILSQPSLAAAATAAGVAPRTLDRWLAQPAFRAAVDGAAREIFQEALIKLRAKAPAAADTVDRLRRKAKSEAVRLRAALAVFNLVSRADLEDILQRLEALEEEQREENA